MKAYNIVTLRGRDSRPCATLFYEPDTDAYSATIADWAAEKDIPAMWAPFLEKRMVPDAWARRWVMERVVPAERQNLGEILRANSLDSYDAIALLESGKGESASDDFLVFPADDMANPPTKTSHLQEEVGVAVRQARMRAGMTQAELAERTGLKQSQISALESGRANPTLETLACIAKGLGVEAHFTLKP